MSETLKIIGAVAALAACIIFLGIATIAMFRHTGPDERHSRTRMDQTDKNR